MAVLIDSSIFIGFERRGLGLGDLPNVGPDQPTRISSVTASELLAGLLRAAPSRRRRRRAEFIETTFATIPVIPFDLVAARIHADLWTHLATAGTPIGPYDALIAATALARGYAVVTDNVREFRRVPGLVVIQPTWPG